MQFAVAAERKRMQIPPRKLYGIRCMINDCFGIRAYSAMSKFGVVVMGPAGAGKVCALTALYFDKY